MAESATHIDKSQITGLILAGGRGMRMGGVDKGLQRLHDKTMVEHVIARLAPQVGRIIINANQNLERYRALGSAVWPDTIEGYQGPLAGMHAGLSHCETEYLLTVPCDAPMLPDNLAQRLSDALASSSAELAVAVTGETTAPERQPVFCMMKKNVLAALTDCLHSGNLKVDQWIARCQSVAVHFENSAAFANINTQKELQKLEQSG